MRSSPASKKRAKVLLFFDMTKFLGIFFAYLRIFLYFCTQIETKWTNFSVEAKHY